MAESWSSLEKEESVDSPFNDKLGCFKTKLRRLPFKTAYLFVEWGSNLASQ